jgi:hypothetical protein
MRGRSDEEITDKFHDAKFTALERVTVMVLPHAAFASRSLLS